MVSLPLLLAEFATLMLVIAVAGYQMTKYGDMIAVKTGLGRIWIGLILIATATSFPELFTGIGSLVVSDLPEIAVGDVLGSCIINLFFIVIADFLYGKQSILGRASQSHILSAGFGIFMASAILFAFFASENFSFARIGHVGIISIALFIIYLVATQSIYKFEKYRRHQIHELNEADENGNISLARAIKFYSLSALVVIAAAIFVPQVAASIADATGLANSFVGTTFVALTTSLPEAVVIVSAIRMGLPDLAIANVLGSNLFNMTILAFDDVIYTKGVLLLSVSSVHIGSLITMLAMYGMVIIGVIYRLQTEKFWRMSWETLAMMALYIINSYLLLTASRT